MAVRVPKGRTSDIVFTYSTPGLMPGMIITLAGAVLLTIYMLLWKNPTKRRRIYMNYIEDDSYKPDVPYDEVLFEEYEEEKSLFPPKRTPINQVKDIQDTGEVVNDTNSETEELTQPEQPQIKENTPPDDDNSPSE